MLLLQTFVKWGWTSRNSKSLTPQTVSQSIIFLLAYVYSIYFNSFDGLLAQRVQRMTRHQNAETRATCIQISHCWIFPGVCVTDRVDVDTPVDRDWRLCGDLSGQHSKFTKPTSYDLIHVSCVPVFSVFFHDYLSKSRDFGVPDSLFLQINFELINLFSVYYDVSGDSNSAGKVTITAGNDAVGRTWKVLVQYIECSSPLRYVLFFFQQCLGYSPVDFEKLQIKEMYSDFTFHSSHEKSISMKKKKIRTLG